MFDFVEKIVYINLSHREDRKQQILSEFSRVGVPKHLIERFDAIKHERGAIGCTMSHIAVLKMAIQQGWQNYIVLEDDIQWNNFENGYSTLSQCYDKYDVVILGGSHPRFQDNKLVYCQTTTGYVVNKHYYTKLLANFEEGLSGLLLSGNIPQFAIDIYWNRLIQSDNWGIIRPSLVVQRPGYSDIEKRHVDYLSVFN